jgi:hypothetical protein
MKKGHKISPIKTQDQLVHLGALRCDRWKNYALKFERCVVSLEVLTPNICLQIVHSSEAFCRTKCLRFQMLFVQLKSPQNQWTINKILIQAGLVLCNFFMHDFALTQTENLHHLFNLHDNFRFSAIWHKTIHGCTYLL